METLIVNIDWDILPSVFIQDFLTVIYNTITRNFHHTCIGDIIPDFLEKYGHCLSYVLDALNYKYKDSLQRDTRSKAGYFNYGF